MTTTDQGIVADTEVAADLSLQPSRKHTPVTTIEQARALVAVGADMLDRERPDWAQQIDTGRLNLAADCWCILGQLEGTFWAANVRRWGNDITVDGAIGHGFHCGSFLLQPNGCTHCRLLQEAWIEAIADRVACQERAQ